MSNCASARCCENCDPTFTCWDNTAVPCRKLPKGWPRYLTPPEPRDWTEDPGNDPDNGCYQNACLVCKEPFVGNKRRVVCKLCADADNAEAKRRAEWLHEHNAPKNWIVLTGEEVDAIKADLVTQTLSLSRLHILLKNWLSAAYASAGTYGRFIPWDGLLEETKEALKTFDKKV